MHLPDVPHVARSVAGLGGPGIRDCRPEMFPGRCRVALDGVVQTDVEVRVESALVALGVADLCRLDRGQNLWSSNAAREQLVERWEWFAIVFLVFEQVLARLVLAVGFELRKVA